MGLYVCLIEVHNSQTCIIKAAWVVHVTLFTLISFWNTVGKLIFLFKMFLAIQLGIPGALLRVVGFFCFVCSGHKLSMIFFS